MSTHKYFVRILLADEQPFLDYLESQDLSATHISTEISSPGVSCLYAIPMDREQALTLKLTLNLLGCVASTATF